MFILLIDSAMKRPAPMYFIFSNKRNSSALNTHKENKMSSYLPNHLETTIVLTNLYLNPFQSKL